MPVVSNAFDALDRQREIREGGEPSLREQFVTLAAIGDEVEIGMLDAGVVGEQSGNIRQAAGVEVIVVGANQIFVEYRFPAISPTPWTLPQSGACLTMQYD